MASTIETHRLRVDAGNAKGREIALEDSGLLIGRLAGVEGTLGDDPELSRTHARISAAPDGGLLIEDLGSTNGTYVNDALVRGQQRLQPGDVVEVGQTRMTVLDPAGRSARPTAFGRVRHAAPATARHAPRTGADHGPPPVVHRSKDPAGERGTRRIGIAALGVGAVIAAAATTAYALSGDDDAAPVAARAQAATAAPARLTAGQLIRSGTRMTAEITTRGALLTPFGRLPVASGGSGIVVDADEGYVLTNAHVVAGQTAIKAQVAGGVTTGARVVAQAPCEDLALLQLRPVPTGLTEARLGSSTGVRPGDRVTGLGYPTAFEERLGQRRLQGSEGIVTARTGRTSLGPSAPAFAEVIQHQAPMNGGNSGGPLLNDRGEVVGVNTFVSTRARSQNQNAAIAIDRVEKLLPDLRAGRDNGYVGWALTAVEGDDLPLPASTTNRRGGALAVLGVDAGSPADRRGFEFGDTVYALDGTPVHDVQDVCDILNSKSSGDTVAVTGYSLPPFSIFATPVDPLRAATLRDALRFERTLKLR